MNLGLHRQHSSTSSQNSEIRGFTKIIYVLKNLRVYLHQVKVGAKAKNDQRPIRKYQTSKKIFAFTRCEWDLRTKIVEIDVKLITILVLASIQGICIL